MNHTTQFIDAIRSAGISPPDAVDADGVLHRFSSNGKPGDDSGWYVLHGDGIPAGSFGDWRTSLTQTWRADIGRKLDHAEETAHRARVDTMRKAREAEEVTRKAQAAIKAASIWGEAPPATEHPYLKIKGIQPHGAKLHEGALVVPVRDINGVLHSLQFIDAEGMKLFLAGGRVKGCYFSIGKPDGVLCIAEGFATGATIHEVTGHAVAVAFNAGNLETVAKALRAKFPDLTLIVCADDDRRTDGNPGLTKATEAARAVGGRLAVPDFGNDRPAKATDFNDLAAHCGTEAVRACIDVALAGKPDVKPGSWALPATITQDEWIAARPTPHCIVQDYLYSDVGVLIGAGASSKTTLVLVEGVHIVLGKPLYGLRVFKPGPVVLITAEDSREMLVARLRSICTELGLTAAELEIVWAQLRISDVSGNGLKLTAVVADVVLPNLTVDEIIDACRELAPVMIVIDPAVSFGVGESRVNDAEQGLVEAARRMRRALSCCVRYVHHTGKQNARDGAVDQYAGRGGSAFADGARMVHVLQSMTPKDWQSATGTELSNGEIGLRLARPKMTYCAPQGDIFIRRAGYLFTRVDRIEQNQGAELAARANQVWQLLESEVKQGRFPTQNSLQEIDTGLTRAQIRGAVAWLESAGRVEHRDRPSQGKGGSRTYIHPTTSPDNFRRTNGASSENSDDCHADENTVIAAPPPIGKTPVAHQYAPPGISLPYGAPELDGAPTAHLAQQRDLRQELSTIEVEL